MIINLFIFNFSITFKMQTQTKISLIINNKKQIMNKNDIFGTLFDNLTLNKVKFNDVGWKINGQITDIKRNQQL